MAKQYIKNKNPTNLLNFNIEENIKIKLIFMVLKYRQKPLITV
jgi:hypothetical protein